MKARAWASRAKENWFLTRNQCGDWTRRTRVLFKWTRSNIIRLQELRFNLHRFFDVFVNAWPHLWHRNSRMWHGRSREKSRHRSCQVCYELRFKIIKEIPWEALLRPFNHPRPLIWLLGPSSFFSPFSVVRPTQIFFLFFKKKGNDVVKPFFF